VLGLQTALALVTVLTLSSAQAGLIETNRDQPGSQSKMESLRLSRLSRWIRLRRESAAASRARLLLGRSRHSGTAAALPFVRKGPTIKPGTSLFTAIGLSPSLRRGTETPRPLVSSLRQAKTRIGVEVIAIGANR